MTEDKIQQAVAYYLDLKKVLWMHVANERQTSPRRGGKLKKMGVKKGVPDVWILEPRGGFKGCVIELKTLRGKPTQDQRYWIEQLQIRGYSAGFTYGIDNALESIKYYLDLPTDNKS